MRKLDIKHRTWEGTIVIHDDNVTGHRLSHNTHFYIYQFIPKKYLTVRWYEHGIESFHYNEKTGRYEQNYPIIIPPAPIPGCIAIIPAKEHSERCSGKNLRPFARLPLFLWSVLYAISEGIKPVVATDSVNIANMAKAFGAEVFMEKEDEVEDMVKMVENLLEVYKDVDTFALLQPTSPYRKPGTLYYILQAASKKLSIYTCQKIKVVGQLGTQCFPSKRWQDAKQFLYQADGNMFACSTKWFLENKAFVTDKSHCVEQKPPYCYQIDTEEDFTTMDAIWPVMLRSERILSSTPIRSIAIVQNVHVVKRDYSSFIDSCDLVIRVGKGDNLSTGRTGKRADIWFLSDNGVWNNVPDEAKHLDTLKKCPLIFNTHGICPKYGIDWAIRFPWSLFDEFNYTSAAYVTQWAAEVFPASVIYLVGKTSIKDHFDGLQAYYHASSEEEKKIFWRLQDEMRLIEITKEDESTEEKGEYSTLPNPITTYTPDKFVYREGSGSMGVCYIHQPMKLAYGAGGSYVKRVKAYDGFTVTFEDGTTLHRVS